MKSMVKILLGAVAGAMILAVAAPIAEAQCVGTSNFASIGGSASTNKMSILPGGAHNSGAEFGRLWVCDNSNEGNNFVGGDPARPMDPAGCPSTGNGQTGGGWWQVTNTSQRGVDGFADGPGCGLSSCPINSLDDWNLCLVVEDWGASGPPGVGDTAHFVGWRTNVTPASARPFDLAHFCGAQDSGAACTAAFEEFPVPRVTSATKSGLDRDIETGSDTDPAINVYVQTPAAGPASGLIDGYDLMIHTGAGDPGRDRNADCGGSPCWSLLGSLPYGDAALPSVPITVPCPGLDDAFIAFGMTFAGGPPGGPVPSQMVGRAIQIECGGNIADPIPTPKKGIRLDDRPGSGRTPSRTRGGR